jgi:OmpA-OmpF porin, OOP family
MELRQDLTRRRALRLLLPAAAVAPLASCAAPPRPPQPVAPPAPVGDRAYIVFFPLNSAEIGERGRQIIAEAAKNLGTVERGTTLIELDAYADRSGSPGYNRRLSRRRAEAVAAELRRQGVRPERITIRVHGEGRSFVPTRDGEQEAQNRGVWITHR